jgi:hypothetical protein
MAACDVLEVKIPAEGIHGGCVRSPKICDRSHISHATQCRPHIQRHADEWSGGIQKGYAPGGGSAARI